MRIALSASIFAGLVATTAQAFSSVQRPQRQPSSAVVSGSSALSAVVVGKSAAETTTATTVLVNPDMTGITEPACLDTAARMQRTKVPVSTAVHPDGQVGISYAHWPATRSTVTAPPPVVLVHGFDSSCLEYRRLGARLAERGIPAYAVDLLGWGFTQLDGVTSFSATAKVEALQSFIETVVVNGRGGSGSTNSYVIGGASLGGAAAIEAAAKALNENASDSGSKKQTTCAGLILLDAQGFVDGIGPMASMPTPIAGLGVQVLKSLALRSSANQMSYFDTKTYATDEAVTIGRVHCLQDGWKDALVSFMQSGGFSPSKKVPTITVPSLVLWGRQDGILDGKEFARKFLEALPDARLEWIEECGHVPHLEQPDQTADAIQEFVQTTVISSSSPSSGQGMKVEYTAGIAAVGAATIAGILSSNIIPFH